MKHFFVILALMLGVFVSAQSKKDSYDITVRSKAVTSMVKSFVKGKNLSEAEGYATLKLDRILFASQFTEEEKLKLTELFKKQYAPLSEAANNFKDSKTEQSKINFIKLLIEQEEETRKLFTDKQLVYYLSYWNMDYSNMQYIDFRQYCMPDHIYYGYKKELL